MAWQRRRISLPPPLAEFIEEQLLLGGLEHLAVERRPGDPNAELCIYVEDPVDLPGPEDLARLFAQAERRGLPAAVPAYKDEILPDRDWNAAFRERFTRRRLSDRFAVLPPWERDPIRHGAGRMPPAPGQALEIVIEPGQAFGTGEHPTTLGCLERLADWTEKRGGKPWRCLDVGSGTGILAIAARLRGAVRVEGYDIDPACIRSAYLNTDLNGLAGQIRFRWGEPRDLAPGSCELVLANLFLGPILRLLPRIDGALAPDGSAILSGFLAEQGARISAAARARGWRLLDESIHDEWVVQEWSRA